MSTSEFLTVKVLDDPRFVGLWTYKPQGAKRKFCASVRVNGLVAETGMYDDWADALVGAREILDDDFDPGHP